MKLLDVNLLLYATNTAAPRHKAAKAWFEQLMNSGETVALPWAVLLAFVRLTTNPRVLEQPLAPSAAIAYLEQWRAHPSVAVPEPTDRHPRILEHLLSATGVGGNLVSDAHIAALAIEHGATLCSVDSDFARFPGLNWLDPIRALPR
ncbi:MAG: type II toxin-antitoxin system VapC family toxin [Acidimicrobiales bacterium]|nr:type II toxin-antitoxin system VapC family toxin [Acidimicrobiales bacterium]